MNDFSDSAKKAFEKDKEYKLICGEIIRLGFATESHLAYFIRDYFYPKEPYREIQLYYWVLMKMEFGKKIQLFETILKKNDINQNKIIKIMEALRFINTKRNMVAHHEAYVLDPNSYEVAMSVPSEETNIDDMIDITDELLIKIRAFLDTVNEMLPELQKEIENNKDKPMYF